MGVRPAKMKRWAAFFLTGLIPLVMFITISLSQKNILFATGAGLVGIFIMVIIGGMVIKTPYTMIFEEAAYLTLNISSTGGIIPFIMIPQGNKIVGSFGGQQIEHMMDREAVNYLKPPKQGKIYEDGEKIVLEMYKKDIDKNFFATNGIPTFIYSDQLGTFLSKEMLSNMETKTFARHEILYLNQMAKELNSHMLNFGRYVIELTKPLSNILENPWIRWILILVLLGGMAYFFGPALLKGAGQFTSSAASSMASASGPIVPK